jgi:serine/threonine-protein kinase
VSGQGERGTVVAGRYRIEAALGEGSFGAVYRAQRIDDGAWVALKILHEHAASDPETRARLRREATALATLAHPHVVSVVELGEDAGRMFLVTELLEGRTLADAIEQGLEPAEGLRLVDQVLGGLAFAHAMGVTHRDLKPGNVFVVPGAGASHVKILDFGLAKFDEPGAFGHHTQLTRAGAILGTPDYMAPEQVFGPKVDARADVYAAGIVLFEVLTGRTPFAGETELTDLFRAHAATPPPTLAETRGDRRFAPALEAVVKKALEKRPDDRFADARAMRTALSRVPKPAVS